MINLNIPQLFVHFGVLFWCFHKNALAQPQKMQLRIKVAKKNTTILQCCDGRQFAALGGEPVGRLAPAGPLDTSGPNDLSALVAPRDPRRSRGVARARAGILVGRWD